MSRPYLKLRQAARNRISWSRSAQRPQLPRIPELFNPNFLDELLPPTKPATIAVNHGPTPHNNSMISALSLSSHRTWTDNGAMAYDSTLSPTLDAFNKLTRNSTAQEIRELLDNAWAENPDTTLKVIWNLRSIHEGKSEKEAFYMAFGWLYDKHPRTAIANLHNLVDPVITKPKAEDKSGLAHGYWKDLLNILVLATVDELRELPQPVNFLHNRRASKKASGKAIAKPKEGSVAYDTKPVIKARRMSIGVANQERVVRKLETDPKYRALYVAVARLFTERLIKDFKVLLEANTVEPVDARDALLRSISLASKWAPSLLGAHDRKTNIATAVARLFYHYRGELPQYSFPSALKTCECLEDKEPTEIMRSFYRRWVLSPLRAATMVTERLMSSNQWNKIVYSRVSSICMRNNKDKFLKHDLLRFHKFLRSVEAGTRSISGATLLPHELLQEIHSLSLHTSLDGTTETELRVAEAQWKSLVNKLRESGRLDNSIAVCDVSGSMGLFGHSIGLFGSHSPEVWPIYPAVALSLILAQLAKPPFSHGFITFSATPRFVRLQEDWSISKTIETITQADWGMNTNLEAVFLNLILPLAKQHNIPKEDMIKRLFIFSDMQFDAGASYYCTTQPEWETNYDRIELAFRNAGYDVPQIVYWNLENGITVEVQADRKGVALMSGFSPSMLKVFMGEEEEPETIEAVPVDVIVKAEKSQEAFTPWAIMTKALSRPSFDGLVVMD
ncbi:hypothetical protein MIND_00946400 [Mycena indigotica]|uniref:Uncharacterized protein n=1 Tax=Mycena indigotica TaxID=2126181 RepID=A0A8H6SE71_9AGAR|nr:uncharacterized protein MIND_00946400 [Mycena indigotica]KAF7297135.1 hypothetical protein MIND_00946400 [Mycena indigotica]